MIGATPVSRIFKQKSAQSGQPSDDDDELRREVPEGTADTMDTTKKEHIRSANSFITDSDDNVNLDVGVDGPGDDQSIMPGYTSKERISERVVKQIVDVLRPVVTEVIVECI